MKKSEIAGKVFETLDALPLTDVAGGPLTVPAADLAALSLVPWFCDASVQWALRLTMPGTPLKKTLLKKLNGSFISEQNGAVLIGVPGDGIEPGHVHTFSSGRSCGEGDHAWHDARIGHGQPRNSQAGLGSQS
jgi:hypothetical protein